jgi:hypothetical protein
MEGGQVLLVLWDFRCKQCCFSHSHDSSFNFFQRCQIKNFKSARSDVKIRQNPPSRIGQIRQNSARNWNDFRLFFTLRVVFVAFLVQILPYPISVQGGNI